MKHTGFLLGAILFLFVITSSAQENSVYSFEFAPSNPNLLFAGPSSTPDGLLALAPAATLSSTEPPATLALGSSSPGEPPAQRPGVYGVFENYKWQAYVGYAFFRFFAFPSRKENMNGVDLGLVYYPTGSRFGVDGDILGEFGTFLNHSSHFTDYLGGPRFRWQGPRGIEFWAHGMVGYAKFLPQTAEGGQTAFSYEAGGGVDIALYRRRIAYRIEADAVGTKFFHTDQVSPKISVGVVYKF